MFVVHVMEERHRKADAVTLVKRFDRLILTVVGVSRIQMAFSRLVDSLNIAWYIC